MNPVSLANSSNLWHLCLITNHRSHLLGNYLCFLRTKQYHNSIKKTFFHFILDFHFPQKNKVLCPTFKFLASGLLVYHYRYDIKKTILGFKCHLKSKQSQILCFYSCLLYTSPSPRDATLSRMPSSA